MRSIDRGWAAALFCVLAVVPCAAVAKPAELACNAASINVPGCTELIARARDPRLVAYGYYYRGIARLRKGDLAGAISDETRLIAMEPKRSRGYTARGLVSLQQRSYDRAIADFGRALDRFPGDWDAREGRAAAYAETRSDALALADYDVLIAQTQFPLAYVERATVWMARGEYAKAIADLQRSMRGGRAPETVAQLGRAYRLSGNSTLAVRYESEALASSPRLARAWFERGAAFARLHQDARAFADLTRAVALDPKHPAWWVARGNAATARGSLDVALSDYDRAIALDPRVPSGYANRCWTRVLAQRAADALTDCNRALEATPDDPAIFDSRGFANLALDRVDAARADFDWALSFDPRFASSLYGRGITKGRQGDVAGGEADVAAARALNGVAIDDLIRHEIR